jgi:hypothetical protein
MVSSLFQTLDNVNIVAYLITVDPTLVKNSMYIKEAVALLWAVRKVQRVWRLRRLQRRSAAAIVIQRAWLHFMYCPGGKGAALAASRFVKKLN